MSGVDDAARLGGVTPRLAPRRDRADFGQTVRAAAKGDKDALTTLYRSVQPDLAPYLRARFGADEGDDVASEAWIDVAAGLDRFVGREHEFRAWVFCIARRRGIDRYRARRRRPADATAHPTLDRPARDDPASEAVDRVDATAAIEAIAQLPSTDADVLLLRLVAGCSAAEVGAIIGKSPGAVRVIQHRALRRLARTLRRTNGAV